MSLLLLPLLAIPVYQRIVRYRAERLLADIRSLKLGTTTYAQAQTVFRRWERWDDHNALYDTPGSKDVCDERNCIFDIRLQTPLASLELFLLRRWGIYRRRWLEDAISLLGGRFAIVRAYFHVRNGILWDKGIEAMATARQFYRNENRYYSYDLEADSESTPRFYAWGGNSWSRHWPSRRFHLEYVIGGPDGCTGCLKVATSFTPYAAEKDVEMLSAIDLSCLTRWLRPCRTKADIMPAAMARFEEDYRKSERDSANGWDFKCDPKFIEVVSRDTDIVAVAEVLSNYSESHPWSHPWTFDNRVKNWLKRKSLRDVGPELKVNVFSEDFGLMQTPDPVPKVHIGDQLIVLLGTDREGYSTQRPTPWLELCGALPMNDANLAIVQTGISKG